MIHYLSTKPTNKYYVELITDVQFSQFEDDKPFHFYKKLKMDILYPQTDKPLPLVIFIDGGRFLRLNKTRSIPHLVSLAESGYVVASIEHRISSEAKFPAQLFDVKTAVRFLRANAHRYNIDPDRIGVWGKSAGATLASLLGTTGEIRELEGNGEWQDFSSKVHAVVDLYGPVDFIKFESPSSDTAGSLLIGGSVHENKEKAAEVNPASYISEETPPFLILHGDADDIVPCNQSEIFYEALKKANVDVTFYRVEGAGHNMADFVIGTNILEIVQCFFDEKLKSSNRKLDLSANI